MKLKNLCVFFIILLMTISVFLWIMPIDSFAQGITGKISGNIKDSQTGEALPGVNVMVEGTTYGAATSSTGDYFILGIPPGIYAVTANIIGYQKLTQTDVRVLTGRTTPLDFALQSTVIESKEAVVVTAVRPTIIRDLTATAVHVDAKVFESAPIQGTRDMISLTAGILRDADGDIMIRGGEINQINFYVDGVSLEKTTTQEHGGREEKEKSWKMDFNILGVQEMQVVTGGFNAEYGNIQSGVVNIVTKEGGSMFHGEFRAEYGFPGQHHFGKYLYDHSLQIYKDWWEYDKWLAYNNTLPAAQKYKVDSLLVWHKKFQNNLTPNDANKGGAYDYRNLSYKRLLFGFGGPLAAAGNKLTFFFSGELRYDPTMITNPTKYFDYRNIDGTITYRPTAKMKLKIKMMHITQTTSEWQTVHNLIGADPNTASFHPRFFGYSDNYGTTLALIWTHTLSPTTFYEVLVSSNRDDRQGPNLGQDIQANLMKMDES